MDPFLKKTEIELYGINPFKTESHNLIEILTENNKGEMIQRRNHTVTLFLNLQLEFSEIPAKLILMK